MPKQRLDHLDAAGARIAGAMAEAFSYGGPPFEASVVNARFRSNAGRSSPPSCGTVEASGPAERRRWTPTSRTPASELCAAAMRLAEIFDGPGAKPARPWRVRPASRRTRSLGLAMPVQTRVRRLADVQSLLAEDGGSSRGPCQAEGPMKSAGLAPRTRGRPAFRLLRDDEERKAVLVERGKYPAENHRSAVIPSPVAGRRKTMPGLAVLEPAMAPRIADYCWRCLHPRDLRGRGYLLHDVPLHPGRQAEALVQPCGTTPGLCAARSDDCGKVCKQEIGREGSLSARRTRPNLASEVEVPRRLRQSPRWPRSTTTDLRDLTPESLAASRAFAAGKALDVGFAQIIDRVSASEGSTSGDGCRPPMAAAKRLRRTCRPPRRSPSYASTGKPDVRARRH